MTKNAFTFACTTLPIKIKLCLSPNEMILAMGFTRAGQANPLSESKYTIKEMPFVLYLHNH
jgi:hypothetical protein